MHHTKTNMYDSKQVDALVISHHKDGASPQKRSLLSQAVHKEINTEFSK